jgi:hypothetical protein
MARLALLIGIALCLTSPRPAHAADERMAGVWTLNYDQSENLGRARLDVEMTVSLDGENLVLTRKGKIEGREEPLQEAYTYLATGEEHTVKGAGGNSRQVRARWASDKLQVTWEGNGRFGEFEASEVWQIKNDQILIKTTFQGATGSFVMKSYYDRLKRRRRGARAPVRRPRLTAR